MASHCRAWEGMGMAGQGRAGQGRAMQGRAGQGRAGQGRRGTIHVYDHYFQTKFSLKPLSQSKPILCGASLGRGKTETK